MIYSSDSSDDSKDSSSSSDDDSDEGPSAYKNAQQGICKLCHGDKYRNKDSKREQLVRCAKCRADGQFRFEILYNSMYSPKTIPKFILQSLFDGFQKSFG